MLCKRTLSVWSDGYRRSLYLFLQPVVVLDDARHDNVGPLHVECDVSRRLLLMEKTTNNKTTGEFSPRAEERQQRDDVLDL